MMGVAVLLHRWLGIAFCLLFAMWFATGIVMHFVPFPSLTEPERFAGLASIEREHVAIGPSQAVEAIELGDVQRVRLIQRSDGPVYVVSGPSRSRAVHASNATDAAVRSPDVALATAIDHARRRGIEVAQPFIIRLADHDQWSVPNVFDRHRPLFRVALDDAVGTDIYVSSVTGEVVLDTTRSERWWNFVGSVLHWIYPTILRSNWALWDKVVWTLSLLALIGASLGAVLGVARIRIINWRVVSPYRDWHGWHHVIGLISTVFVLTWIFSGWLSMDHGRLFSRGQLTASEADTAARSTVWGAQSSLGRGPISPATREIEWFAFNGRFHRRDRIGLEGQVLFRAGAAEPDDPLSFLSPREIQEMTKGLAAGCGMPSVLAANEDYPVLSTTPGAPVYRAKCGNVWYDVDGANGIVLQRLDPSRRTYLRFYSTMHTLDVPILASRPLMRSTLIISFCFFGFVFSLTGVAIGWHRLRGTSGGKEVEPGTVGR
jgi:hypothetical protein